MDWSRSEAEMANEPLFTAFPPATREQWEAVIKKELKDKDPSTLDITVDGTTLKPFGMASDAIGVGPHRRGTRRNGNTWRAGIELGPWQENANAVLLEALMGGADSVVVTGDSMEGLEAMLADVLLGAIDLHIPVGSRATLEWLLAEAKEQGVPDAEMSLYVNCNAGELAAVNERLRGYPRVRLVEVDDQQHGHSLTALALERGRKSLSEMIAAGLSVDDACARLQFRLVLGDDLFLEAARLRAFREAWACVVAEFKPQH
ncbi:MAG TPA: methylmalonyl-CoA mutase family protein, partial [Flavobacteriales bacterium]|nr:methylmalonyl-CoA mutase family protein [Flavobacteriales bacterium]